MPKHLNKTGWSNAVSENIEMPWVWEELLSQAIKLSDNSGNVRNLKR